MAKEKYDMMYKCKMCGEIFAFATITDSDNTPAATIIKSSLTKRYDGGNFMHYVDINTFEMHECVSGDFGDAEYIGIKKRV